MITGFLMNNQQVAVEPDADDALLQKSIATTPKITLAYDQSMLEFEVAALNYTLSEKNRFAYQLEGLNSTWIPLPAGKSSILFTYLPPGNYTLRVKGSNNDGVWNEKGVLLEIEILPPFWKSKLAYLFYFILAFGGLNAYRTNTLKRLSEKSKSDIDELKLRFFANVSHELRTPLTLIAGPLKQLVGEVQQGLFSKDRLLQQFSLMQRNTERLLLLTNQLLDLQKSETGTMQLNLSSGNLLYFLHSLFEAFVPMAREREMQYAFVSPLNQLYTQYDADKLEKIVVNLLSNAFKFTKSSVTMTVKIENEQLVITVEDDGIGIARKELENIFRNFYQIESPLSTQKRGAGTGIGLALARELVLLHKGTIHAESELGNGSCFTVLLPILPTTENAQPLAEIGEALQEVSELPTADSPLLLLVEDNVDMRLYIRDMLQQHYRLIEAENGKIGVQRAIEDMPDLIVSDVMMLEMDGMELCHTLKNDERTSHIPIVLLTALGATENKLKGLQTGADDYVTKPFHAALLLVRIQNLIASRKLLQLKFKQPKELDPRELVTNLVDENLLKRGIELVESNMENLDFGIQQFIEGMPFSRRGLYNKIKAITGMTISEFIISIRLRHAAKLLLTYKFSISEISYKVGFQNRSQLNRAFKEQFSMTPTEYQRKQQVE